MCISLFVYLCICAVCKCSGGSVRWSVEAPSHVSPRSLPPVNSFCLSSSSYLSLCIFLLFLCICICICIFMSRKPKLTFTHTLCKICSQLSFERDGLIIAVIVTSGLKSSDFNCKDLSKSELRTLIGPQTQKKRYPLQKLAFLGKSWDCDSASVIQKGNL